MVWDWYQSVFRYTGAEEHYFGRSGTAVTIEVRGANKTWARDALGRVGYADHQIAAWEAHGGSIKLEDVEDKDWSRAYPKGAGGGAAGGDAGWNQVTNPQCNSETRHR